MPDDNRDAIARPVPNIPNVELQPHEEGPRRDGAYKYPNYSLEERRNRWSETLENLRAENNPEAKKALIRTFIAEEEGELNAANRGLKRSLVLDQANQKLRSLSVDRRARVIPRNLFQEVLRADQQEQQQEPDAEPRRNIRLP